MGEWGIGRRAQRLVAAEELGRRLTEVEPQILALSDMRIVDAALDIDDLTDRLYELFWAISDVVDSQSKWVAVSKTLHHVLPDLVVPIDGTFTTALATIGITTALGRRERYVQPS